jgi:hypothetical protein
MNTKRKIAVFLIINAIGIVIGILGSSTFSYIKSISPFYPAAAIQSVAGLFFGMTGVIAGVTFSFFSNFISGIPTGLLFLLVVPNFIQSYLPFLVKKKLMLIPYNFDKRTVLYFIVFCVILPNILSAIWVANIDFFVTKTQNDLMDRIMVALLWLKANVPSGILFGLLLLKTLAPSLRNSGLYDE